MNKGFLFNTKMVMRRLSKEGKGKVIALDTDLNQDNMKCPSPHNMFSCLYSLDIALIRDTLCDDFLFDWETVARTLEIGIWILWMKI